VSPLNEHKDMIAITAYYRREAELKAQVDDLQRQLDNARTDWLCETCDGRGCEAENQNCVLLAELEEQARLNGKGSEREAALLAKVETLQREHAALENLIIKAGYIITNLNGEMALCRDPWHQPKEDQP
jgi:cell division protein FtsB